jgi:hypothetical protein
MNTVNRFIVEIDPTFYTKQRLTEDVVIDLAREGSKFQRLPTQGKLAQAPKGSNIPIGAEVFYHHFAIDELYKVRGINYIPAKVDQILAYKEGDTIKGFSKIVARRILTEQYKNNETAIIKLPEEAVQKYESHCFIIEDNPTSLKASKGDKVWIYTNTDYLIESIDEYSFIRPEKVVYNETTEELFDPYGLLESNDSKSDYEKVGSIYVPHKATKNRNTMKVVIPKGELKKGDEVYVNRTKSNKLPIFKDGVILDYRRVMLCL